MSNRSGRFSLDETINQSLNRILRSVQETAKVDAEALGELQRLTTLAETYKSSASYRRKWHRTPLLLAAIITLAITSALLFRRIAVLEFSLDAKVSEMSFLLKNRSLLNRPWSALSVSIEDAEQLIGPSPDARDGTIRLLEDHAYATFSQLSDGYSAGNITIQTLVLDGGVRVALARRYGDRIELRLTPAPGFPISTKILLKGPGTVTYPETSPQRFTFSLAREVIATATKKPLVFSFVSKDPFELAQNIAVTALTMTETQDHYDPQRTLLRTFSSVRQATLYQESLDGSEVRIRKGQELEFDGLDGILRSVGIEHSVERPGRSNTLIALEFSGAARGVHIGHLRRNGMPSALEWLAKRKTAFLFWGVSLYVIGLIASVWGWYRKTS